MDPDEHEAAREAILDQDNDDDLEFYITFPSPAQVAKADGGPSAVPASPSDPNSIERLTYTPKDEPEPVVYLLGWAGAEDKHLAKYSRIYEDAGCITIRYTAPAEYIFFAPEKIRPLAKKLLDLVEEMSLEGNPVLFHVFSNNGATVYQHMSECLREAEPSSGAGEDGEEEFSYASIVPSIRGQVFDSGPGRRTATSFVKAASAILGGSPRFKKFPRFAVTVVLPVLLLLYVTAVAMIRALVGLVTDAATGGGGGSGGSGAEVAVFDYLLKEDGFGVPQLFLYSHSDDVIAAADVAEVAAAREKAGCDVTRVTYDESPHVQHLRSHRESYVSSVVSFLGKCLKEGGGAADVAKPAKKQDLPAET